MGWWKQAVLAVLVAGWLAVAGASPAHAGGASVGVPVDTCILADRPGITAGVALRDPARFDCATPQTAFGPGDFWVLARPLPATATASPHDRVRTANVWQRGVTLHARYPDGRWFVQSFDDRAISRHLQLGAMIEWRLPRPAEPGMQLLWHVEGAGNARAVLLHPTIARADESAGANLAMAALYAAFGGLAVALLVYNAAMWAALRHDFQLAYCGMVLALLGYAFTSSGAIAWADPTILNTDRVRLNYAALALAVLASLQFARTFFEPAVCAGTIARAMRAISLVLLLTTAGVLVFADVALPLADRLYSLTFLGVLALVAAIMLRARRQRSRYLWLFTIAWGAPVAFAGMRVLGNLAVVPSSFWLDNSTLSTMTFEALMSSIAIAYRMRQLSRERDEARSRELAARLLADTDPLTGLLNRRAFLHQAIGRGGEHLLVLVDIDHFKQVNDTIGHDGGDEVLRIFARTLHHALPPSALIARMGGEEFALLLPAGQPFDAESLLMRFRTARMPFDLQVTASIGTCSGPLGGEADWKALYRAADRALFDAKSAGRDRARPAPTLRRAA